MEQLPKRLKQEPLIEVVWQLQFEDEQGIGDVLPGILYAELRKTHTALQLRRLPAADIPAPIAQMDPNLRLAAKMLMEEPGGSFIWQVGDRVITLNCRKPYVGWDQFKQTALNLIQIVEASGLIPMPQRHSLRFIDLLQGDLAAGLAALRLTLELGDHVVRDRVQMRLEIPDAECLHIVQIATAAQVHLAGEVMTGCVIDLETLPAHTPNHWNTVRAQLDTLHQRSKTLFFQQILTAATIQQLEPEY